LNTTGRWQREQRFRSMECYRRASAFNAIDPPMATQTMEPNAYRYHGGPKYNDWSRTTLNGSGRLPWLDCPRRQQRIGPSLGVEAGAEA